MPAARRSSGIFPLPKPWRSPKCNGLRIFSHRNRPAQKTTCFSIAEQTSFSRHPNPLKNTPRLNSSDQLLFSRSGHPWLNCNNVAWRKVTPIFTSPAENRKIFLLLDFTNPSLSPSALFTKPHCDFGFLFRTGFSTTELYDTKTKQKTTQDIQCTPRVARQRQRKARVRLAPFVPQHGSLLQFGRLGS